MVLFLRRKSSHSTDCHLACLCAGVAGTGGVLARPRGGARGRAPMRGSGRRGIAAHAAALAAGKALPCQERRQTREESPYRT